MKGTVHFLLLLLVLAVEENAIKSPLASASGLDGNLQHLKRNFSTPVVDALLKFDGFRKKFDVPYLEVTTALTYVREIAKATAYTPLFENKMEVEEFVTEHLLRMVLPSSPDYCSNLNCVASRVGEILAEIPTEGGFLPAQVNERILQIHAGNLVGNILWRLSRLQDPDVHVLETLRDVSSDTITRFAMLVKLLSVNLRNSTLVTDFCNESSGLDEGTAEILSSAVCGSVYLRFNLSLLESLSQTMEQTYNLSKTILDSHSKLSMESLVVPSIIAETIIFNVIKQGFTLAEDKVEEVSRDIQKFIMLGITMSQMKLDSSKAFVKHSFSQYQRASVGFPSVM